MNVELKYKCMHCRFSCMSQQLLHQHICDRGKGYNQARKEIKEVINKLPKYYTAQVLTDDLATVNFVGKEVYDKFKNDKGYSFVWVKLEDLKKIFEKKVKGENG